MAWKGYLNPDELRAVRETLVAAELFSQEVFGALLSVLPASYRALVPNNPGLPPAMRIDQTLGSMNGVVNLRGGEVPLKLVLAQAADYAADAGQRDFLEGMVATVDARRPTPAEPAAAIGAAVAPGEADAAGQASAMARLKALVPNPTGTEMSREAMIGEFDDTLSIDFLARGLEAAHSVFKIVVQRHFDGEPRFSAGDVPDVTSGTAWMIRPGIGITNHHVFNARTDLEAAATKTDFAKQAATARLIEDYRDAADERAGLELGPESLLYADEALDFALFRLPSAVAGRPALRLRRHPIRKTEVQKIGDRVNLLQHPMGRPMRLGFRNNFVVLGNNNVLAYLTDTDRGSSGAPVCDDSWSVAALHVGSQKVSVPGIKLMDVEIRRENFGVPIRTILGHVQANAPEVFAAIGGAGE